MGADTRRPGRVSRLVAGVRSRVTAIATLAVLIVLFVIGIVLVGAHRRLQRRRRAHPGGI